MFKARTKSQDQLKDHLRKVRRQLFILLCALIVFVFINRLTGFGDSVFQAESGL